VATSGSYGDLSNTPSSSNLSGFDAIAFSGLTTTTGATDPNGGSIMYNSGTLTYNPPELPFLRSVSDDSGPTLGGDLELSGHIIRSSSTGQGAYTVNHPIHIEVDELFNTTTVIQGARGQGYSNANNVATTGGSGTGMRVNIDTNNGNVWSVVVVDRGNGYQSGDFITISGGNGTAIFQLANYNSQVNNLTRDWTFNLDGEVELPSGPKIVPGYPGQGYIGGTATLAGAQVYLASTDGTSWVGVENSIPSIGNGSSTWYFGSNGGITFTDSTIQSTAWTGSVSALYNGETSLSLQSSGRVDANGQITITSQDITDGGDGYVGFLKFTNIYTGGTNVNKSIRMNSTGNLQIVNSAYSSVIFDLADTGDLAVSGKLSVAGPVQCAVLTVATLPAPVAGMRAFVNDALGLDSGSSAPTYGMSVTSGTPGNSFTAPVWSDGINWYIG
jgi:hypothetical protein